MKRRDALAGLAAAAALPCLAVRGSAALAQSQTGNGMGGALAWPACLRKLDRELPGYDA